MSIRFFTRFGLFILCLATLACGGGSGEPVVPVHGKLTKGGQPLVLPTNLPPGDPGILVRFASTTSKGDIFSAKIDPATGAFTVPGANGNGIKPGTYKVEVQLGPRGKDEFKGKYAGEKTPITRTVEAGKEIDIDLDKPNG